MHDNACPPLALTYDDVLLVPCRSAVASRRDVDTSTRLTRRVRLNIPIVAANMDTVTEARMARAMAREGGIGVIHRFMPIEQEAAEVQRVKRPEESIGGRQLHTIAPTRTLGEAITLMGRHNVNSLLVVGENDRLLGIVTSRDVLFAEDPSQPVERIMTGGEQLVTAPVGTRLEQARRILHEHRLEKLPLVDETGHLRGLITARDVLRLTENPFAARDVQGRLLVGAAIGAVGDYMERAAALVAAGVDVLVVDIAHGHSEHALTATRCVKDAFPSVELISGNVATTEGAQDLIAAGADAIKVGVGPGAACSTRIVAGVGVPQLTALWECVAAAREADVPVIADGGVRNSGDMTKALAAGAETVMIGSLLAGTEESPGRTVLRNGGRYKVYRGMASLGAAEARRQRETSEDVLDELAASVVPEGVEAVVQYRGSVADVLYQHVGGLRSGMSYLNARTLTDLRANARFVRMTDAGRAESEPHDLQFVD
ncbi:MAG: IMP dehydrogenase [Chloroflexi bacterium]|nr:IMP dehydrogenase [Chloroflexota bacterium]MBV9135389.1 IMP dehydrogenase [Chloroflexota bacterium]MBV9898096.1 IMP dehydrogenase [Chloroflexota bacterium]